MEDKDITYVINAHTNHPSKPSKAFRKWDGKTPAYMHPLWCATTIAAETNLDEITRYEGELALLYHDVLEDTTLQLPNWLSERIKVLVGEMTFPGGMAQEMKDVWDKSKETRLYKLYDKIHNLLDGAWMDEEKRKGYEEYTRRLCEDVERNYGELNITRMMKIMRR